LYKDTIGTVLASVAIDSYNIDTTITVSYNKASNKLTVTNSRNSNVIEYTPEDTTDVPNLNGYFKVQGNSAGVFTLFNMKLEMFTDKIIIDQWKYDKTFSAANTQSELEADGFTFSKSTTPGEKGLLYQNKTFTFGPNGGDISGDYYFETKLSRSYNTYYLDFNRTADNGYYRIWYGVNDSNEAKNKPWIKLQKYDATLAKTIDLAVVSKTSGLSSGHTKIYKGIVKTLEDGSVDINIEVYNSNGTTLEATLAYTDTATDTVEVTTTTTTTTTQPVVDESGNPVYEDDGVTQKTEEVTTTETATENVDTGKPLTSGKLRLISNSSGGNSYMSYLKMYSIGEAVEGTPTTYEEQIINKTFSSADTEESIKAEGFTTSKNSGVTVSFADNYLYFSGKTNSLIYTNDDATSGSYSFSTKFKHGNNYARVYFNYKDSNNYYALWADSYNSPKVLTLRKVCNGTTYILGSVSLGSSPAYAAGRVVTTVNVKVTNEGDGNVGITAKWSNSNLTHEFTYIDSATDMIDTDGDGVAETNTGAPVTSGNIRVYQSYSASYVYSFSLVKHTTVIEGGSDGIPVFEGKFTSDTGTLNTITKGNIYFEYPTAMLGNYKAVATLYEDYKMTGIKVIEPSDLYLGKVMLFDTSASTAENIKIRVFFLDGDDKLKIVADEIYELK